MSTTTGRDHAEGWAVPGYVEQRELGHGASGRVVEAVQEQTTRQVAIRYLSPDLVADPDFLTRFRTQMLKLKRLDDPSVVRVYDYAEDPERPEEPEQLEESEEPEQSEEPDALIFELRKRAEEANEVLLVRMLVEFTLLRSGYSDEVLEQDDPLACAARRYNSRPQSKRTPKPKAIKCARERTPSNPKRQKVAPITAKSSLKARTQK